MQALSIAYGGMNAAMRAFEASAARTVRDSVAMTNAVTGGVTGDAPAVQPEGDFVTQFVEQRISSHAFSANIAVAKTADEMIGQLLNIKA